MTIPDELVQAAAEALDERLNAVVDWDEAARIALQAAFAKLPECDAARKVAALGVAGDWALFRNPRSGGTELVLSEYEEVTQSALAALAREFGGQE